MKTLSALHADIDARVSLIRSEHADWLCRRGCDACCHRLAEIPQLTAAEWALLREGLIALPPALLQRICKEVATLAEQQTRPIVCPFLDRSTGSCRVYFHRPIACRTYGFYVQRDKGLYCNDIENQVARGILDHVVWGNQDAIDHRLKDSGETRALTEWFLFEMQSASESHHL
ncbi:MAG: YkgJ family cysteine cluster protein [Methylomonas sp.]|jgi:Fe-S-cluster containining protein|uniref:YkgJ family cysteine cluster protein n=1 Tax=Methylomonas sp. TaxID=418 RepID=UPI0026012ED5|nr:YkgJ family cysteine cluster protein [Methylomonas sp.]MCK9605573.1 YkgJ family cysteine cluster protein [Methylomonas sp.]